MCRPRSRLRAFAPAAPAIGKRSSSSPLGLCSNIGLLVRLSLGLCRTAILSSSLHSRPELPIPFPCSAFLYSSCNLAADDIFYLPVYCLISPFSNVGIGIFFLFYSLLCAQYLEEEGLAHSRHSTNFSWMEMNGRE